jgi:ABC-type bacteriocin/lantibiotic exporter with double-glycine peptidase domain
MKTFIFSLAFSTLAVLVFYFTVAVSLAIYDWNLLASVAWGALLGTIATTIAFANWRDAVRFEAERELENQ